MTGSRTHRPSGYDWRGELVGRDHELSRLRESLRAMCDGAGSLVLLSGDAGIGKTSLVSTIAREAAESGASIATSACYDLMDTPPYGPWIELLGNLHPHPEEAPSFNAIAVQNSGQDALYADALELLQNRAEESPTIAILEDLHWADAASLELLRFLARNVGDLRVLIIVTYRDTELDRGHPLQQLLPLLVRESQATRINLRPLNEPAIRELIEQFYSLDAVDTARLVRYLCQRTEGNPFFIGETLRSLEEQGHLTRNDAGWRLQELEDVPIPPLVQQLIEGRLNRLGDEYRRLLSVAAVVGAEISLDIWRSASGADDDELSGAIRQAIDLHLMQESPGAASLAFTHALIREALYYELGLPQRRALHRRIGESLAAEPSPEPDAVAFHLREARHERAAQWLVAAGERAQHLYAWRTAAERLEASLPSLSGGNETAELKGWLCYRIGLLLIYAAPERAIEHLTAAEKLAGEGDGKHLAAYARADRGLIRCIIGDVRRGLAEMRSGVDQLDQLPAIELAPAGTRSTTDGFELNIDGIKRGAFDLIGTANEANLRKGALVFWLAWAGRYTEAIEIGEPYVRHVPNGAAGMQDSLGDALAGLGHAYAALGRPDEALETFARARASFQVIDHHFKVGNTAIYELSEALLPFRADRVMERQWLADQAEAG